MKVVRKSPNGKNLIFLKFKNIYFFLFWIGSGRRKWLVVTLSKKKLLVMGKI